MPYFQLVQYLKIKNKGTSLVEILLVITLVGFLVLIIGNLPNSIALIGKAGHQSLAREIGSKKIEDLRSMQYINLANGESPLTDFRLNQIPSGAGTYLIEDCDPLICVNGEQIKKAVVTVFWKEGSKDTQIKLETLISEGGIGQ